jgi:hypothetical protein
MGILRSLLVSAALVSAAAACADAGSTTAADPSGKLANPFGPSYNWTSQQDPIAMTLLDDRQPPTTAGVPITMTAQFSVPGNYYIYWSMRWCTHVPQNPDVWIECGELWPVAEGWNLTSYSYTPHESDVEFWFHAEAREANAGYTTTTSGARFDGPAIWAYAFGPDYGNPWGFSCDRQWSNYYPFQEWKLENGAWTPTGREFRRSGCDGSRQYNPSKPATGS